MVQKSGSRSEAAASQFKSRAWQAEHGADEAARDAARRLIAKENKLQKRLTTEKHSEAASTALLERLDQSLRGTDVTVQSAECGETICQATIIHENDLDALDFHPDKLMAGHPDWPAQVFVDRAEEDDSIQHRVYFEDPKSMPKAKLDAMREIEKQERVLQDDT